jgi:hypothetical protein
MGPALSETEADAGHVALRLRPCSTIDQDLRVQREVIRAEKASGSRRDGHTELQVLLDFVRSGNTLVVTRIDRLARSMKDLQDIVHELKAKGVALRATEQPINTGTAAGKAFLGRWACSPGSRPTSGAIAERLGIGRASVYRVLGKAAA